LTLNSQPSTLNSQPSTLNSQHSTLNPQLSTPNSQLPPIHVVGYPADIGGANTELWHTLKLWRSRGLDVTLHAVNGAATHWRARCDAIGCRTAITALRNLSVPEAATVVAFCHQPFLREVARLQKHNRARVVHVPCMTYLFPEDRGQCDVYCFQSRFQMGLLAPQLEGLGVGPHRLRLVGGAFDAGEIPFRPRHRSRGDPFMVGRLSRPDGQKFRPNLWQVLGGIPNVRARVMGWTDSIAGRCGPPPTWAEVLPKNAEPVIDFLAGLHCMLQDGEALENRPRTGLEAMAAGVPIVAPDRGGWPEMVRHGVTGLLGRDPAELTAQAARLEADEPLRLFLARQARQAVEGPLTDPGLCWSRWRSVFES